MRLKLIVVALGVAALATGCDRQENAHSPPRVTEPTNSSDTSHRDVITPATSATTTVNTASAEGKTDTVVNTVDADTAKAAAAAAATHASSGDNAADPGQMKALETNMEKGVVKSSASEAETGGPTARDTSANNPTGDLTKQQESTEMPKAGQANNHSSPSMEESRK
jgi:hypothetical protein